MLTGLTAAVALIALVVGWLARKVYELPQEPCDDDHAEHRTRLTDLERWRTDFGTRLKVLEQLAAPPAWLSAEDAARVGMLVMEAVGVIGRKSLPADPPFAGVLADLEAGPKGPFPG